MVVAHVQGQGVVVRRHGTYIPALMSRNQAKVPEKKKFGSKILSTLQLASSLKGETKADQVCCFKALCLRYDEQLWIRRVFCPPTRKRIG